MNTKIIIGVVIVLALLGIGGWYMMSQSKTQPSSSSNTADQSNPASGVISSIKDAMSNSVSLKCDYTDEDGNKTMVYIKGQQVRSDSTTASSQYSAIVIGNKMWSWDNVTKKGMKMEVTDEMRAMGEEAKEKMKSLPTSNTKVADKDDLLAGIEKYKQSCKPESVGDDRFVPPTDVQFQDYTEMMKSMQEMMKVSGTPNAGDMQKQVEEMMKKVPTGQ